MTVACHVIPLQAGKHNTQGMGEQVFSTQPQQLLQAWCMPSVQALVQGCLHRPQLRNACIPVPKLGKFAAGGTRPVLHWGEHSFLLIGVAAA